MATSPTISELKVGPDGKGLTKVQVTFTWTLGYATGQAAVDSEGRAFQVFETYDAYQNPAKPSKLDKALTQILNAAPPLLSNTDQLEPMLLGRSNELFITKRALSAAEWCACRERSS